MATKDGFYLPIPPNRPGKAPVLVVTPVTDLGELICESLKDVTECVPVSRVSRTITYLKEHPDCQQVILDMEMGEMQLIDVANALRSIKPAIKIVIISKDDPSTELEAIQPWKILHKPLLLQDLLDLLGFEFKKHDSSPIIIDLDDNKDGNKESLSWINNANVANQLLTSMIVKSRAQEAILIQNHSLWSYTGHFPDSSIEEVNHIISKSWSGNHSADLMRYIKLETTQTEHALYATLIAVGVILALIFDPEISFSVARNQTKKFASNFLLPEGDSRYVKTLGSGELDEKEKTGMKSITRKPLYRLPIIPVHEDEEVEPSGGTLKSMEHSHLNGRSDEELKEPTLSLGILGEANDPQASRRHARSVNENHEIDNVTQDLLQSEEKEPIINIQSVSDGLYHLTYSCLLIPRFSSHRLTVDQAKLVANCMNEIYISFGWRLESLETKPDYLRWAGCIPPTIALTTHIDLIRKETSKQIFDDFPPYRQLNLSGDFWAPGYLIMSGKNAISDQLIIEFTNQSRQKYGMLPPKKRSLQYTYQLNGADSL